MKHGFAGGMDIQLVSHQLDCALRVAILFDNLAISMGHIALICVTFLVSHHLDLHVRDTNIYSRGCSPYSKTMGVKVSFVKVQL